MVSFFKGILLIAVLFVAALIATVIAPEIGFIAASVILGVSALALFRPMPRLGLGNRGKSFAILFCVGLPATIGSSAVLEEHRLAELESLKASDPRAYLATLKEMDQERWLAALAEIDPERHESERARILSDKAAAAAEKKREQEIEAAQRRAEECGEKNETTAYVMSQHFVERQLKAPTTADFPFISAASLRTLGDCRYEIVSYVDAQNGFGAMIRSYYSAVMVHYPEDGTWAATELQIR